MASVPTEEERAQVLSAYKAKVMEHREMESRCVCACVAVCVERTGGLVVSLMLTTALLLLLRFVLLVFFLYCITTAVCFWYVLCVCVGWGQ